MVSHLNSFRYIEMDGEFIETPFQHFEEVPPTLAAAETVVDLVCCRYLCYSNGW